MNFDDVDLENLIKVISQTTGDSFLYDKRQVANKKITFLAKNSYTPQQAFSIFEAILDSQGLSIVKKDEYYDIIPTNNAKKTLTPFGDQNEEGFVTTVYEVINNDVNIIFNTIRPFISANVNIVQFAPANLLIIRDRSENVRKTVELLDALDGNNGEIQIYRQKLKYTSVTNVENILKKIYGKLVQGDVNGSSFSIIPEKSSNSLLVLGNRKFFEKIKGVINQIDVETDGLDNEIQLINVEFGKVNDFKNLLTQYLTQINPPQQGNANPSQSLIVVPNSNQIIFTGTSTLYRQLLTLIESLNGPLTGTKLFEIKVFDIKYSKATTLAPLISQLFSKVSGLTVTDTLTEPAPIPTEQPAANQEADKDSTIKENTNKNVEKTVPKAAAASNTSAVSSVEFRVIAEAITNKLIVLGEREFIEKVEDFLAEIDTPTNRDSPLKLEIFTLKFSDPTYMAQLIKDLFGSAGAQTAEISTGSNVAGTANTNPASTKTAGNSKVNVFADTRTSRIIVLAPPEMLSRIKDFISEIDTSARGSGSLKLHIFDIKYSDPTYLAKLIKDLFGRGGAQSTSLSKTSSANNNVTRGNTSNKLTPETDINVFADTRTNKLIVLATNEVIQKIELLLEELDKGIDTVSGNYRVYKLNYTSAEEIAKVLQSVTKTLVSENSKNQPATNPVDEISITSDKATNSLVIYADTDVFEILENVIRQLDVVHPQVYVEAIIMEVTVDKALNLGFEINAIERSIEAGEVEGVVSITNGTGKAGLTSFSESLSGTNGAAVGVFGKPFTFNGSSYATFTGFLKAIQTDSEINILASPHLIALNNVTASIKAVDVRAFQKETVVNSSGTSSTSFEYKDIGVSLELTPQINPDNTVKMELKAEISDVKSTSQSSNEYTPETLNRVLQTTVLVEDRQVVVLGGLINDKLEQTERKIPCLGDIPYLGWLFKTKETKTVKTNLLVYISPTVLKTSDDIIDKIEKLKNDFNDSMRNRYRESSFGRYGLDSMKGTIQDNKDDFENEEEQDDENGNENLDENMDVKTIEEETPTG